MKISDDILRYLTVRVDEEMRHGQKVAKRTKVRVPRRIDGPGPMPEAMPASALNDDPMGKE